MFGRPPRSRQERGQLQQLTEEQLKQELHQQANEKKRNIRIQQLQEKEENLKQLEHGGQDVQKFREKVIQEYQDVLPIQQKAELDRAQRIKLREEERLRRQNGLGSAYDNQKQLLPYTLEQKLKENLNQANTDWLDQQNNITPNQRVTEHQYAPQNQEIYRPQSRLADEQIQQSRRFYNNIEQNNNIDIPKKIQSQGDQRLYDQQYEQPIKQQPNTQIYTEKDQKRLYREQLDMQISQKNNQLNYGKPQSQQSVRNQQQPQPVEGDDFFSKFGQPHSQQSWRSQQQQSQPNITLQQQQQLNQKQKYKEELDRQIQEKKIREQQQQQQLPQQQFQQQQQQQFFPINDSYRRPQSNPTNQFDYQNAQELETAQSPGMNAQSPPYQSPSPYQSPPPQSAPQGPSSRFVQRRFTSGVVDDERQRQQQAQQQQYAEELKRQMEEKQRVKKQQQEEEKKREELEMLKYEQQRQQEQKQKEDQFKQKQNEIYEHQIANKQLAKKFKKDPQQDVIKKSALQVLQSSPQQESEDFNKIYKQNDQQQQYSQIKTTESQRQNYQDNNRIHDQDSHRVQNYQDNQNYLQNPAQFENYHQSPFPYKQSPQNPPQQFQSDLNRYQQHILFDNQNSTTHTPQNVVVHQQYLMQLQQNRQEIELVKQILEEKLRFQQIEMQNQLLIDQYARKVSDIQREQKLFEQEIIKLQDFITGKQKKPLDPQVYASSVFFSQIGKKEYQQNTKRQYPPIIHESAKNEFLHPLKVEQNLKKHEQQYQQSLQQQLNPHQQQQQQQQYQQLQYLNIDNQQQQNEGGITESMIDNDIELPGESEYVKIEAEYFLDQKQSQIHLNKSFLPELRELKQNREVEQQGITQQQQKQNFQDQISISIHQPSQIQPFEMSDKKLGSDIKINSSEQFEQISQQFLPHEEELVSQMQQESQLQKQQQQNSIQQLHEDVKSGEDEQIVQDIDQSSEDYYENDLEEEENQQDDQQEQQQDEDKESYEQQEVIGRKTNYDLEMLRTHEYMAMFKENIQAQSKQQELKFPTKMLHLNTLKLQSDLNDQQFEQSEEIQSRFEVNSMAQSREVQMSAAQFEMDQQSMALPDEEEELPKKELKMSVASSRKYQTPKTLGIFPKVVIKTSIATSINELQQQHNNVVEQSNYTNVNPISSQSTFLMQPRAQIVKSRLDQLFQNESGEIQKNYPKVPINRDIMQDHEQSEKLDENSQWKKDVDRFAQYEQSNC